MRRKKNSSLYKSLYIIFILILVGILSTVLYFYYPRSQASVFEVSTPQSYGPTTITGMINLGPEGDYLLYPAAGSPVRLAVRDIDQLLGYTVTVKGELSPPANDSFTPVMTVSEIISN